MNKPQLNMRIAMRARNRSKIDAKSIQSVPDIDCFIEPEINEAITQGCREVLMASYNSKTHQHGECALLISTLKMDGYGNKLEDVHEILQGNYVRVRFNGTFSNIVKNRKTKDLILIHNHPNNSTFSYGDLKVLSREQSILGIVAIGNTRNLYIALDDNVGDKITRYVEERYRVYVTKNKVMNLSDNGVRAIKDTIVAKEVLTNPSKFSMVYDKYNRRSV